MRSQEYKYGYLFTNIFCIFNSTWHKTSCSCACWIWRWRQRKPTWSDLRGSSRLESTWAFQVKSSGLGWAPPSNQATAADQNPSRLEFFFKQSRCWTLGVSSANSEWPNSEHCETVCSEQCSVWDSELCRCDLLRTTKQCYCTFHRQR